MFEILGFNRHVERPIGSSPLGKNSQKRNIDPKASTIKIK
jgi:hypothetical protein